MALRCLVAAGDPAVVQAASDHLRAGGHELEEATDVRGLLAACTGERFDLVVIGALPDASLVDACARYRAQPGTLSTYVLVARRAESEQDVVELLSAGASDVLDGEPAGPSLAVRIALAERRIRDRRSPDEVRHAEGRLIAADRMASMGVLAAGVAHELNNPLSYLTMSLEHLSSEIGPILRAAAPERETELSESLHAAIVGCERMRVILSDLQTFARSARWDRVGPVDVRDVLDASIAVAYNEIRHRARLVRAYAEVDPVSASQARLGQVFLNLLTNAVHAIPVGATEDNEIRVTVQRASRDRLVVEISDTGEGIASEHLPHVFEPFFTTKGDTIGTGLGLAICERIVRASGGTIAVTSTPGKGATFRVELPTVRQEPLSTPPRAPSERPLRGRMLIVDDEPHVAESLRRLLQRALPEAEIVLAAGGDRALELIGSDDGWDAILCDVMMPHISGIELHDRLAEERPELAARMVFMTGGAFTERARNFVHENEHRMVSKPFELDEVIAALERTMTRGSRPR